MKKLHCSTNIDAAKLVGTMTIFTILHVSIVTVFATSSKPSYVLGYVRAHTGNETRNVHRKETCAANLMAKFGELD